MFRIVPVLAAALAAFAVTAVPAVAKECKRDPIIQESTPYVSRTLGAFPSSLVEWRRAVVSAYGDGWQSWRRAEDRRIDCEQIEIEGRGKRWVCTRSARPCSGAIGPEQGTSASIPFPGKMRRGSRGKGVRELQRLLNEAGYTLDVDGNFGRGTRNAVRDFQSKEGLAGDGVVGEQTWDRLVG